MATLVQTSDHNAVIELQDKVSKIVFYGTQAEWDALSVDEKAKYTFVNISDKDSSNTSTGINPSPSSTTDSIGYIKLNSSIALVWLTVNIGTYTIGQHFYSPLLNLGKPNDITITNILAASFTVLGYDSLLVSEIDDNNGYIQCKLYNTSTADMTNQNISIQGLCVVAYS